jgi:N-acetylmuramoyl-L-alanine amidase
LLTGLGITSDSGKFCNKVLEELVTATGLKKLFVKTGDYAILKLTNAPACLGLPGYINNPIDKPKLLSESVRKAIGLGYLKALQRDQGLPAYQPK